MIRFRPSLSAAVYLFAAVGVMLFLVTVTPVVPWYAGALGGERSKGGGDVLIVLGGGTEGGGFMDRGSYERALHAVHVLRETPYRTVVLSGGGRPVPPAVAMRDFLVCQGVPASEILLETDSISTRENGTRLKPLLDRLPGKKVLLTSDFHMFRAMRVFRKLGVEVSPEPAPDVVAHAEKFEYRWYGFMNLMRETAAIGYYWARGWI